MDLQQRINAFITLGHFLGQCTTESSKKRELSPEHSVFIEGFKHQLKLAEEHNSWFTRENLNFAIKSWSEALTETNLNKWITGYDYKNVTPKTIAIIMAGNIPLVGFHDFLSVLITGHKVLVKQSSNDKHLLPYLAKYLEHIESGFKGRIQFTEDKLEHFDAVIATGSNNTARYFEYYFKDKPSIIRKNRNSIAVLTGNETTQDLENLSDDIFRYYGLGCRNVSKIYIPKDYDLDIFFKAIYKWHPIIHDAKYANNYDYNKAVYLMSEFDFLENGFVMLKQDEAFASPIATIFYERYEDLNALKNDLSTEIDQIQCIVSREVFDDEVTFGQTQKPELWDYADGVDTVEFLLKR